MNSPVLERLTLTFEPDGVTVRTVYRRGADPNPGTVARRREVAELARDGLERALAALDADDVEDLGISGFEMREDVLGLPVASRSSEKTVRERAA